jgi:hypothetical protein
MLISDNLYKQAIDSSQHEDQHILDAINEMVKDRIADLDLKSYDFNKDPDCSYSFANKYL